VHKVTIPARIQRSRAAGWRNPPSTLYCGRGTRWGNPYRIGAIDPESGREMTREDVLAKFRARIEKMRDGVGLSLFVELILAPLSQFHHLSCFCPLDSACHVDIWIEFIRQYQTEIEGFLDGQKRRKK
jgi:hypothetical protein